MLVGAVLLVAGLASDRLRPVGPDLRSCGLSLEGVVDTFIADYLRNAIEDANETRAAVLLTIDTPGGLDSSMREIIQAIGLEDAGHLLRVAGGRQGRVRWRVHPDGVPRRRHGPGDERRRRDPGGDRRGHALTEGRGRRRRDDPEALAEQRGRNVDAGRASSPSRTSITRPGGAGRERHRSDREHRRRRAPDA